MEQTKKCSKCGEVKGLGEFTKHSGRKDGYEPMCRGCLKVYRADRRKKNPAIVARSSARAREWEKQNPDLLRQTRSKYVERNRERVQLAAREWKSSNTDRVRSYMDSYRQSRAEELKAWRERYYQDKREDVLANKCIMRAELSDAYVVNVMGLKRHETPQELIALKREQLAIKRMARELKKAATKPTGEPE